MTKKIVKYFIKVKKHFKKFLIFKFYYVNFIKHFNLNFYKLILKEILPIFIRKI